MTHSDFKVDFSTCNLQNISGPPRVLVKQNNECLSEGVNSTTSRAKGKAAIKLSKLPLKEMRLKSSSWPTKDMRSFDQRLQHHFAKGKQRVDFKRIGYAKKLLDTEENENSVLPFCISCTNRVRR